MKINAGIVTTDLIASRDFYTRVFGMTIKFESEWFVLLESDEGTEIAFMKPGMDIFHPLFHNSIAHGGAWFTVTVPDVETEYERLKNYPGIEIIQGLKTEDWGERHFILRDPNNCAVDVVQFVGI